MSREERGSKENMGGHPNLHLGYFFCYFSERATYFLLKKDSNIKVVCTFLRNFSMKFFRVYLLIVEHSSTFSVEKKNRAKTPPGSEFLSLLRISEFFSVYMADFWQTF